MRHVWTRHCQSCCVMCVWEWSSLCYEMMRASFCLQRKERQIISHQFALLNVRGKHLRTICAQDMRGTIYLCHRKSLILDRWQIQDIVTPVTCNEAGQEPKSTITHNSEHHCCMYLQHVMYLFHYHSLLCDLEKVKCKLVEVHCDRYAFN